MYVVGDSRDIVKQDFLLLQTELVSLSTLAARRHVSAQDLDAGRSDHVRGGIAGTKRELIAIVRSGNHCDEH